jgi:redox-sensitive bicupin YhaK (pirin superfamily)
MSRNISNIFRADQVPLTPTMMVKRVFPHQRFKNLDPFVFLDHFGPAFHKTGASAFEEGTGAHPHRGFITFTYLLEGDMEHRDSRGHHSVVSKYGVQWMKAASGIMHDEKPSRAFLDQGGVLDGFQLWINLPAKYKEDTPMYQPLSAENVMEVRLGNQSVVRVLLGDFENASSPIPTYSPMSILHIRLAPNAKEQIAFPTDWNVAAYLPAGKCYFGESQSLAQAEELVIFEHNATTIVMQNLNNDDWQDIFVIAGEPIGEPIIASGPFVMHTFEGLRKAYDDFYEGKYGNI